MANPTLSANGSLQINLLAGRVYSFSTGGDFSGGTLASELLLDDDTPVPISDFAVAGRNSPQTASGTINFLASSTRIRLTLTGATNPSITYAITLTTSVIGASNGSEGAGDLISTNNLSDLTNTATARTNLGLGTAATTPASAYTPSTTTAADIGRSLLDADEIIVGNTKSALSRVATYLIGVGRTWLGNHIFSGQTTMPNQTATTADAVMTRALADARYVGARLPLLDWAYSGWSGTGAISSRGAAALNMTVYNGAAMIESSNGFGRVLSFDGVNQTTQADSTSVFTDRLHSGNDFTFLMEGESLANDAAGLTFILGTGTNTGASTGVACYISSGSLVLFIRSGEVITHVAGGIPFVGVITKIAFARSGSSARVRFVNSTGTVYDTGLVVNADAGNGASSFPLRLFTEPQYGGQPYAGKLRRLRIWDTYIDPELL